MFLKQKLSHTLYCKRLKKEILLRDCSKCKYKEYKFEKIKNKTTKISKSEKNRFSLFISGKDKCMFCESNYQLTWHKLGQQKFIQYYNKTIEDFINIF